MKKDGYMTTGTQDGSPVISVIIPVHRADPRLLERSLASTIDLERYECIVVFDGQPTSELLAVTDHVRETGQPIRTIVIAHAGVAAARNVGMKAAKGRWLTFLDADDSLLPDGIRTLAEYGKRTDCQIVQGAYMKVMPKGQERCALDQEKRLWQGSRECLEFCASVYQVDRGTGTVWSKLFRRDFVEREGLVFDTSLVMDEDAKFVVDAARKSRRIGFVPVDVYRYNRTTGSTVTRFREQYRMQVEKALVVMGEEARATADSQVMAAYEDHVVFYLMLLMMHYVFNSANGWDRARRKKEFHAILDDPLYSNALHDVSMKYFDKKKRFSVIALRHRSYWAMAMLCGIRNWQLRER